MYRCFYCSSHSAFKNMMSMKKMFGPSGKQDDDDPDRKRKLPEKTCKGGPVAPVPKVKKTRKVARAGKQFDEVELAVLDKMRKHNHDISVKASKKLKKAVDMVTAIHSKLGKFAGEKPNSTLRRVLEDLDVLRATMESTPRSNPRFSLNEIPSEQIDATLNDLLERMRPGSRSFHSRTLHRSLT
eukprot:TRINITY_DN9020_c0_g2_i2.p1 TRINITY_DN9020_c0_g2~~TRINITY_DN9020_c0_g2_i2.p1  ORF type:complete len:184 (-),score=19.62 TRINITY_DN9020_c0_g2_i2:520-1071(-)